MMYEKRIDIKCRPNTLDRGNIGVYSIKLIREFASYFLGSEIRSAPIRDFLRGAWGSEVKKYEVNGKGVIELEESNNLDKYLALFRLEGFDEEDSIFKKIKNKLEEFATLDGAEIEKRIYTQKE